MKETVRAWLESEEIAVFLGYRMVEGHPIPYAFHRERLEELEELVEGSARYPLEKMAMEIQAQNPDVRIGLLTRGCTQRAVNVLGVLRQLEPERQDRAVDAWVHTKSRERVGRASAVGTGTAANDHGGVLSFTFASKPAMLFASATAATAGKKPVGNLSRNVFRSCRRNGARGTLCTLGVRI